MRAETTLGGESCAAEGEITSDVWSRLVRQLERNGPEFPRVQRLAALHVM